MAAIRLLPAPVEPPSALELRSQSTSLVYAPRLALARRSNPSTAYRDHRDVWSVSVGDDGSFNFYAAPRKGSGNGLSSRRDDSQSAHVPAVGWDPSQLLYAAVQYAIQAQFPKPAYGHAIDVYA